MTYGIPAYRMCYFDRKEFQVEHRQMRIYIYIYANKTSETGGSGRRGLQL